MNLDDVSIVAVRPLVFHSFKTSAWSLNASLSVGREVGGRFHLENSIPWSEAPRVRWGENYCNVIYVWDMVPQSNDPRALALMVGRQSQIADELLMNCWWGIQFSTWRCYLMLDVRPSALIRCKSDKGPLHRRTCWTYQAGLYSFLPESPLKDQPSFKHSFSAYDRWVWL